MELAGLKDVVYTQDADGIAIFKMNRPDRLNAWGNQMKRDFRVAWKHFVTDPAARVAILTGEGRAFCAGRDIKEHDAGEMGDWSVYEQASDYPLPPSHVPVCDKPIIAAVNGIAIGAGFAMVAGSDIRIASERAEMLWPELQTGILPLDGMIPHENIPWGTAVYLLLSGERISAARAYEIGFFSKVVPHDQLMDTAMAVARHLVSLPPRHLTYTMNFLHRLRPHLSEELFEAWKAAHSELLKHPDTAEAARAFVEKRRPIFAGD